jgi:hypothetical protein
LTNAGGAAKTHRRAKVVGPNIATQGFFGTVVAPGVTKNDQPAIKRCCRLEIHDWLNRPANSAVVETLGAEEQGRKYDAERRKGADDVKPASKPHFGRVFHKQSTYTKSRLCALSRLGA